MVDSQSPTFLSPDGDPGSPPVTLCCATSDESAVRAAAGSLAARGHRVELAIGVQNDPSLLAHSIEVLGGRGLYVLCRSSALDRGAVDQLRELLREREVPFGRTLTLAVDVQRPRELEQRIVSVLRRMVTGRADGKAKAWDSSVPPGEEDPDTTVRRPTGTPQPDPAAILMGLGTTPENADPHASTSQIEVFDRGALLSDALPYAGADHTQVTRAPTAPPPSAAPMPPMPQAPVAPPVAEPGSVQVMAPVAPAGSDPMAHNTPPPVHAVPEESEADFEPPLTVGGRIGRALASPAGLAGVLGGLVVVVLVVVLISVFGGGDDDADRVATDASNADAEASSAKDEAVKADQSGEAEPAKTDDDAKADDADETDDAKTDDAAATDEAAKADAAAAVDEAAKAEAAATADEAAKAEAAAAEAAKAEVAEAQVAAPSTDTPTRARTLAPEEDPPEVTAALEAREVRALDIFLVAPERKGTLSFESALEYCDALDVAGLTGWRAPSIGELNSIGAARMLAKAVYWSVTPGDTFGDLMLVLNTKKNRISVVTAGWTGAKIVCIRPRQP